MSDPIRLELAGQHSATWDRLVDRLTSVIAGAAEALAPDLDDETRATACNVATDVANIAKGWLQAKLDAPATDNELKMAEIAERFESIKRSQIRRRIDEVELKERELELDQKRFNYWVERLARTLGLIDVLNRVAVRDANGGVTLVLTNEDLSALRTALSPSAAPEDE